jgi:phospholipid-binding lipoprotein MlaA
MNRATYRFNHALDRRLVRPVAKGYMNTVPHPVRMGIANVLSNAGYTRTIVNDLLQAKPKPFASDIGRLLLNSTVGFAGVFDPATAAGLPKNDEDFGQTLGRWGFKPGPYLVLPVLGSSTVRDTAGLYPDWKADLKNLPDDLWVRLSLDGLTLLGDRVELLGPDDAMANAYDPYAFLRSLYMQHREFEVRDGDVPEAPLEEEPVDEEPTPSDTPEGQ